MTNTIISTIISKVENHLSDILEHEITVKFIEKLEGNFNIIRCKIITDKSIKINTSNIIIKQLPVEEKDQNNISIFQRFKNEIASLLFLSKIQVNNNFIPKLIAYDLKNGYLILEDLGESDTIQDILYKSNSQKALSSLIEMYRGFAKLHGLSLNNYENFKEQQKIMDVSSPLCDSTIDRRNTLKNNIPFLEFLDFNPNEIKKFNDKYRDIEVKLFDSNPFKSFIHGDSGPQNVILSGNKIHILDFEFGSIASFSQDIVGHRIGFPQSFKGKPIPKKYFKVIEDNYFNEITKYISISREQFDVFLDYSEIHWIISRLISTWKTLIKPINADPNFIEKSKIDEEAKELYFSKIFTLIFSYEQTLMNNNEYYIFSHFINKLKPKLIQYLGEYKEDGFPAFN